MLFHARFFDFMLFLGYSTLGYFIFSQTRPPINKVLKLQNKILTFENWPQKHWSNLIEWNMLKAMQMWFCGPLRLLCKNLTSFPWIVMRLQLLTIKVGCLWMFMWQENGKGSPFCWTYNTRWVEPLWTTWLPWLCKTLWNMEDWVVCFGINGI